MLFAWNNSISTTLELEQILSTGPGIAVLWISIGFKNCNIPYSSLGLKEGLPIDDTAEASTAQKNTFPTFPNFFLSFFVGHFYQPWSGAAFPMRIRIRIQQIKIKSDLLYADPEPQHSGGTRTSDVMVPSKVVVPSWDTVVRSSLVDNLMKKDGCSRQFYFLNPWWETSIEYEPCRTQISARTGLYTFPRLFMRYVFRVGHPAEA